MLINVRSLTLQFMKEEGFAAEEAQAVRKLVRREILEETPKASTW